MSACRRITRQVHAPSHTIIVINILLMSFCDFPSGQYRQTSITGKPGQPRRLFSPKYFCTSNEPSVTGTLFKTGTIFFGFFFEAQEAISDIKVSSYILWTEYLISMSATL